MDMIEIANHDGLPQSTTAREHLYTLEVTGKDVAQIDAAKDEIPQGTPINIAFLGNETHAQRVTAARVMRECGFEPVPIISSRRLQSREDLDILVENLMAEAVPARFMFVGGDPAAPAGPFGDSLALLSDGIVSRHGIRHATIAAYPEGHPRIGDDQLWRALKWKHGFLRDAGCLVEITTQFGFDADAIVSWIRRLRAEGIHALVRVGVPGPATVRTLVRFARQFGITSSAAIARRYGFSLGQLLHRVGPERFLDRLRLGMAGNDMGPVLFHLYPFGGIADGVRWMNDHLAECRGQGR